ncbi:MAG: hypothetical protein OXF39_06080 [Nitrospira sp.]|nr:hypothetical protein [Nitrospira sp.]
MFDNQQQNQNQVNTGDDISEGKTMKFKYKRRSPFPLFLMRAEGEIDTIEDFFDRAKDAWRKGQKTLEQMAASSGENVPDDWLVDDVAQLKEFAWLYSEFAIIGLWRCIELYRKSAMRFAVSKSAAQRASEHEKFKKDLLRLNIEETKIRCARSVDELRCLNNAIKHERRVNGKLADFPRWKNKEGDKLGDLERHYLRLLPFAKKYLEDLTKRLKKAKGPSTIPAGQVSNT